MDIDDTASQSSADSLALSPSYLAEKGEINRVLDEFFIRHPLNNLQKNKKNISQALDELGEVRSKVVHMMYCRGVDALNAKQDKDAAKLLYISAKGGDVAAQGEYGSLLWRGQGIEANHKKALKWYKKAALEGHVDAQGFLMEYEVDLQHAFYLMSRENLEESTKRSQDLRQAADLLLKSYYQEIDDAVQFLDKLIPYMQFLNPEVLDVLTKFRSLEQLEEWIQYTPTEEAPEFPHNKLLNNLRDLAYQGLLMNIGQKFFQDSKKRSAEESDAEGASLQKKQKIDYTKEDYDNYIRYIVRKVQKLFKKNEWYIIKVLKIQPSTLNKLHNKEPLNKLTLKRLFLKINSLKSLPQFSFLEKEDLDKIDRIFREDNISTSSKSINIKKEETGGSPSRLLDPHLLAQAMGIDSLEKPQKKLEFIRLLYLKAVFDPTNSPPFESERIEKGDAYNNLEQLAAKEEGDIQNLAKGYYLRAWLDRESRLSNKNSIESSDLKKRIDASYEKNYKYGKVFHDFVESYLTQDQDENIYLEIISSFSHQLRKLYRNNLEQLFDPKIVNEHFQQHGPSFWFEAGTFYQSGLSGNFLDISVVGYDHRLIALLLYQKVIEHNDPIYTPYALFNSLKIYEDMILLDDYVPYTSDIDKSFQDSLQTKFRNNKLNFEEGFESILMKIEEKESLLKSKSFRYAAFILDSKIAQGRRDRTRRLVFEITGEGYDDDYPDDDYEDDPCEEIRVSKTEIELDFGRYKHSETLQERVKELYQKANDPWSLGRLELLKFDLEKPTIGRKISDISRQNLEKAFEAFKDPYCYALLNSSRSELDFGQFTEEDWEKSEERFLIRLPYHSSRSDYEYYENDEKIKGLCPEMYS